MKQARFLSIFFLFILATISFTACSDDDSVKNGVTVYSWTEGEFLEIRVGEPLSVSFNAAAEWTAHTDSDWCSLLAGSGEKGENILTLFVTTATSADRTSKVTIEVKGYSSISFDVIQKADNGTVTEDMEINGTVRRYLSEMYLWNEEYKTLKTDLAEDYESFFYDALYSMETNTLDKRITADGQYYTLFSYIEKRNPVSPARTTTLVDKELIYNFGITGITPVSIRGADNHITTYFCIQGVYPKSSAAKVGIKRGSMISRINGSPIDNSNINDYYYDLLVPGRALDLTLTEDIIEEGQVTGNKEVVISSEGMYCNPVIFRETKYISGHKIGYLVYAGFDAAYDQELFDVFTYFKSQNVTDLIIDLRYNGGGHTLSANLMATCIAGEASRGKVFTSLRFNKERMEALGNQREEEMFAYPDYANLDMAISGGCLGLSRVYCLVGNGTASSSELVINSLRGIDVEVILIGEKTTGKNVGMEYEDVTVRSGNVYRIVPITFQSYNAKGEGDYEGGFTPDVEMDETNPYNESGRFYIHKEYGREDEPLYAKAVELITGHHPMRAARNAKKETNGMPGKVCKMPSVYRPGYDGMLRKYGQWK